MKKNTIDIDTEFSDLDNDAVWLPDATLQSPEWLDAATDSRASRACESRSPTRKHLRSPSVTDSPERSSPFKQTLRKVTQVGAKAISGVDAVGSKALSTVGLRAGSFTWGFEHRSKSWEDSRDRSHSSLRASGRSGSSLLDPSLESQVTIKMLGSSLNLCERGRLSFPDVDIHEAVAFICKGGTLYKHSHHGCLCVRLRRSKHKFWVDQQTGVLQWRSFKRTSRASSKHSVDFEHHYTGTATTASVEHHSTEAAAEADKDIIEDDVHIFLSDIIQVNAIVIHWSGDGNEDLMKAASKGLRMHQELHFEVVCRGRSLQLRAKDRESLKLWVTGLQQLLVWGRSKVWGLNMEAMSRNMFKKADHNIDGQLEVVEVKQLLQDLGMAVGRGMNSPVDQIFSKYDNDANGSIGEDEFVRLFESLMVKKVLNFYFLKYSEDLPKLEAFQANSFEVPAERTSVAPSIRTSSTPSRYSRICKSPSMLSAWAQHKLRKTDKHKDHDARHKDERDSPTLTYGLVPSTKTYSSDSDPPEERACSSYSSGKRAISARGLHRFLIEVQRSDEDEITEQDAHDTIKTYGRLPGAGRAVARRQYAITEIGFSLLLCSELNSLIDPEKAKLDTLDMRKPLSKYWISASHNTYLEGRQVGGKASLSQYIEVLNRGCRCVEIDVWDGPHGEPIVTHHGVSFPKLLFRDVVQTCRDHAFARSEYPLIISLEQHCKDEQKVRCGEIFDSIFGDMLLRLPPGNFHDAALPCPEAIKKKVIVKASLANLRTGSEDGSSDSGDEDQYESEMCITAVDSFVSTNGHCVDDANATNGEKKNPGHERRTTTDRQSDVGSSNTGSSLCAVPTNVGTSSCRSGDGPSQDGWREIGSMNGSIKPMTSIEETDEKLGDIELVRSSTASKKSGFSSKRTFMSGASWIRGTGSSSSSSSGMWPWWINKVIPKRSGAEKKRRMKRRQREIDKGLALYNQCIYLQARKFKEEHLLDTQAKRSPCNCSSFQEKKIAPMLQAQGSCFRVYHEDNLSRVYPQIKIKNVNPLPLWIQGVQLVALNYQNIDEAMLLNEGIFRHQNGGCGYVRKPRSVNGSRVKCSNGHRMSLEATSARTQCVDCREEEARASASAAYESEGTATGSSNPPLQRQEARKRTPSFEQDAVRSRKSVWGCKECSYYLCEECAHGKREVHREPHIDLRLRILSGHHFPPLATGEIAGAPSRGKSGKRLAAAPHSSVQRTRSFSRPLFAPKAREDPISPYVKVKINGTDKDSHEETTKVQSLNGFDPVWDETFDFHIIRPDVAILSFQVTDAISKESIVQAAYPVNMLREGVRWVPMWDARLRALEHCGLLVEIRIQRHGDGCCGEHTGFHDCHSLTPLASPNTSCENLLPEAALPEPAKRDASRASDNSCLSYLSYTEHVPAERHISRDYAFPSSESLKAIQNCNANQSGKIRDLGEDPTRQKEPGSTRESL